MLFLNKCDGFTRQSAMEVGSNHFIILSIFTISEQNCTGPQFVYCGSFSGLIEKLPDAWHSTYNFANVKRTFPSDVRNPPPSIKYGDGIFVKGVVWLCVAPVITPYRQTLTSALLVHSNNEYWSKDVCFYFFTS